MPGAFGLYEGNRPSCFPIDRLIEHRSRIGLKGGRRPTREAVFQINGTAVRVVHDTRARAYLCCPVCQHARKYLVAGRDGEEHVLACRVCLHLDYSSRHLHRSLPVLHRVLSLRRRAGLDPKPFTAIPKKQPRYRRYAKTCRALAVAEEILRGHLTKINRDLQRRARLRGL
jgi:hypothetical protein